MSDKEFVKTIYPDALAHRRSDKYYHIKIYDGGIRTPITFRCISEEQAWYNLAFWIKEDIKRKLLL